jgi:hypothetical protein
MREDFDVDALYDALNAQRLQRGLGWSQVMRQINDTYRDVDLRPVAVSTITAMREKKSLNGDGVLQMLIWLDRTPESFVPGHPSPNDAANRLVPPGRTDRILRFRPAAAFWAMDERRARRGLTWSEVAAEAGVPLTKARRDNLRGGIGLLSFPSVVRIAKWLDVPIASLTIEREW